MPIDRASLDNTRVEIGRLQIWYEIRQDDVPVIAEKLTAHVKSELFKGYQGEYYVNKNAGEYVNITLSQKGLKSPGPHWPPCENGLFYWACASNELDAMLEAIRKIDKNFYRGLNLPPVYDTRRDAILYHLLLQCSPIITGECIARLIFSALLGTATVNLKGNYSVYPNFASPPR